MNCPKCGAVIKRFDLSPNCKNCGVHIMYYTQDDDLRRDAKKTELEFASARFLAAKLKAAYIKGRIPILRIVLGVLSVASTVLPYFNITLSFPWWNYEISVGAIGVYNIISDSFYNILPSVANLSGVHKLYSVTLATYVFFLLSVICMLLCFVFLLTAFLNIKKTAILSCVASAVGVVSSLVGTVCTVIAVNLCGGYEFITAKPMFGGILTAVLLGAYFSVNLILSINPPEISVSSADAERLRISKCIKNGEMSVDDLPLPVVEEVKSDTSKQTEKDKKKRGKKK